MVLCFIKRTRFIRKLLESLDKQKDFPIFKIVQMMFASSTQNLCVYVIRELVETLNIQQTFLL